jgi:hypothetical protein
MRTQIVFHGKRHPAQMGEREINTFLIHLTLKKRAQRLGAETSALCVVGSELRC